jgi:predicted permease
MSIRHKLDSFSRDLRFGFRQLRKNPAFTVTAILTLALGVGANTVVFGVLNAVLLRPLPFRDANRLVSIFSIKDGIQIGPSALDARDFSRQNHTFEKLAVFDQWRKNVITSGAGAEPENQIVGLTSSDFFQALGIHPMLGRMFTDEEASVGHNHVALITESFWKTHYARSRAILGRTLIINSDTYTIVGVLPDTIPSWMNSTHSPIGIWEPFMPTPDTWSENGRGGRNYGTVGLLKPDVTIQQARSDLARIAANLAAAYPVDKGIGVTVEPLIRVRAGDLRPQLFLLMGAVTLILLIACSNLASLLLARNSARQREFATRAALGANRNVLIRQILVETLLISWVGGGCGITLAWLINMMIRQQHPAGMPQLAELTLDWRVFLFTFLISTLTNLLFGIAPAILHTRINLVESLKDGGRNSGDRSRQSFRQVLVTAQVALSLMLMVGASLLVETIVRLQSQDLGFSIDHLLKAHFFLPEMQYPTPEAITRFCDARICTRLPDVKITYGRYSAA